ncbi:hypothetical protein KAI68_03705 [bacterium]|nr:hypothetical protein [bacterium]
MKKKVFIISILLCWFFIFPRGIFVFAASLSVTGGDIVLTISTAVAGGNPDPVTSEVNGLSYWANPQTYKITAKTSLVAPLFTLRVLAKNVQTGGSGSGGTAQAQITLSTTDQDIILGTTRGVLANPHTCILEYTASATAVQGTGSDVHIITYTIIRQ